MPIDVEKAIYFAKSYVQNNDSLTKTTQAHINGLCTVLNSVQEERDALKAKCAELEKESSKLCSLVENEEEIELRKWALHCAYSINKVRKTISDKPKTCLAEFEARAIEAFGRNMEEIAEREASEGNLESQLFYMDCQSEASNYARKLRQQAGGSDGN